MMRFVQRSISIFQKEQPKAGDMSDTHFTPGSLQAATRAAVRKPT